MADAVYEVTTVLGKKLVDFDGHIAYDTYIDLLFISLVPCIFYYSFLFYESTNLMCARRLNRSMSELDMRTPFKDAAEILDIHRTLVKQNNIVDGIVYTQVSRGADVNRLRSFLFPNADTTPCMWHSSLYCTSLRLSLHCFPPIERSNIQC